MEVTKLAEGKLNVRVASEGNFIEAGTSVVVAKVVDNFKNIHIKVYSALTSVSLPYFDTDVEWLMGDVK